MFAFKFEMAFYTGLVAGYNLFPTTCFELNILERMELELNLDTEINYISLPEFWEERVAYKSWFYQEHDFGSHDFVCQQFPGKQAWLTS